MKMKIMAVKDIAAEAYNTPFFTHHIGPALREFGDLANNKEHHIGQHPEHYVLYELGEWETGEAEFFTDQVPRQIALAIDLVKK